MSPSAERSARAPASEDAAVAVLSVLSSSPLLQAAVTRRVEAPRAARTVRETVMLQDATGDR
jgi:hypothetical protein